MSASCRHASADLCSALANSSTIFFLLLDLKCSSAGVGVGASPSASSPSTPGWDEVRRESPPGGIVQSSRVLASSTYTPSSSPRIGSQDASAASVPVHSFDPQLEPSAANRVGVFVVAGFSPSEASYARRLSRSCAVTALVTSDWSISPSAAASGPRAVSAAVSFTSTVMFKRVPLKSKRVPSKASVTFRTRSTICASTSAKVSLGRTFTPKFAGAENSMDDPSRARACTHGASPPGASFALTAPLVRPEVTFSAFACVLLTQSGTCAASSDSSSASSNFSSPRRFLALTRATPLSTPVFNSPFGFTHSLATSFHFFITSS